MVKAIRIHEHGGPEVLRYEDVDPGKPGKGEVLVRHTGIGLNFIDTYFRTGLYPSPSGLPLTLGGEAAGEVIGLGEGVDGLKVGDRVAYTGGPGAYVEQRVMPADRLVKIPDGVSDEEAAGMMLKGMTAEYLLRRTYAVKPGDNVLYHAAAGGVGLIFGQWAKHLGVDVIGTVGSAEKGELAKAHGYAHIVNYRETDFVKAVSEITGGRKCDVVYDSVGKDTFEGSLDCLRQRGLLVSFGQSSGAVPPVNIGILSQKGSLYLTRPTLFNYIATRAELEASAAALFEVVRSGAVKIRINQRYPLSEAAQAHRDLEGRKTTGTTVLIP
ncbi:MAG: quinone oxidoreductase [Aquamicrobium sp.]|uniref:quinone oxidoreductase family protein n=1 Tax=Aquamicrobium sp. TaxID=1872579 RepID=UPI00349E8814|nr:quinone oxidoreductase [Aquamicrobium sp.]